MFPGGGGGAEEGGGASGSCCDFVGSHYEKIKPPLDLFCNSFEIGRRMMTFKGKIINYL